MKTALHYILCVCLVSSILACKNDSSSTPDDEPSDNKIERKDKVPEVIIPAGGENDVDVSHIETLTQENLESYLKKYEKRNPESIVQINTRFGNIKIQLFAQERLHRVNFIRLAKLGYYDDTFFHRIDSGFVVQGGNSDKPSTQKLRSKIGSYFVPNEYSPFHKNKYGYVGMAKPPSQSVSNSSSAFEFYIVMDRNDAQHLNGEFTVFGRVIEGMEVLEDMQKVDIDASEWPLSNIQMEVEVLE
jgi:peptidylprolyl isomerase